jgi:transposase
MGNASGVSGGDRNRNARLARLRALVPTQSAIVGVDLADRKQMVVVCDHDSKVLARRTFRCRAWTWVRRWIGPPTGPRPGGLPG